MHFTLVHVLSANIEEADLMSYTGGRYQGAIQSTWLHFQGAVMLFIFI